MSRRHLSMGSNTWFTSDEHYYHKNICRFTGRPFSSVEEMNRLLIENHNAVVQPNDHVWHLGDLAFASISKIENLVRQLNGTHYLIIGNHDKEIENNMRRLVETKLFATLDYYKEVTIERQTICLAHSAYAIWIGKHKGWWNLYGHSHSTFEPHKQGKQMDVGVDNAAKLVGVYRPLSFKEIKGWMDAVETPILDHHGRKDNE